MELDMVEDILIRYFYCNKVNKIDTKCKQSKLLNLITL